MKRFGLAALPLLWAAAVAAQPQILDAGGLGDGGCAYIGGSAYAAGSNPYCPTTTAFAPYTENGHALLYFTTGTNPDTDGWIWFALDSFQKGVWPRCFYGADAGYYFDHSDPERVDWPAVMFETASATGVEADDGRPLGVTVYWRTIPQSGPYSAFEGPGYVYAISVNCVVPEVTGQ